MFFYRSSSYADAEEAVEAALLETPLAPPFLPSFSELEGLHEQPHPQEQHDSLITV